MAKRAAGPTAAWVLGLLSAAPFLIMAGLFCWGPTALHRVSGTGLGVYAAAMVAFMGGARWGLEAARPAPRWAVLGPGMAAPLIALGLWTLTWNQPESWRFAAFIGAFLALWVWDTIFSELPAWYLRVRTVGQVAASASLALALENSLSL